MPLASAGWPVTVGGMLQMIWWQTAVGVRSSVVRIRLLVPSGRPVQSILGDLLPPLLVASGLKQSRIGIVSTTWSTSMLSGPPAIPPPPPPSGPASGLPLLPPVAPPEPPVAPPLPPVLP